jgi:predicted hydrocarbon binding protein
MWLPICEDNQELKGEKNEKKNRYRVIVFNSSSCNNTRSFIKVPVCYCPEYRKP